MCASGQKSKSRVNSTASTARREKYRGCPRDCYGTRNCFETDFEHLNRVPYSIFQNDSKYVKKKKKEREKRAARATAVLENETGSELKRAYKRRSNYRYNLYVDYSRPLVRATFSRNLGHTTNSSTTSNTFVNDDTQTKKTFTSKLTATSPSLTWCKLQIASFQFLL